MPVGLPVLSEILKKVNEVFGVEITDNDRVNIKKENNKILEDRDYIKVMEGDNSEQNKRKKLEEITKQVLLGYVNDQFDFYKKMENPQLINLLTNELYKNYSNKGLY